MNRPNKRYHENTPEQCSGEHSSSDDDNESVTPKKKLTYEHKFQLKWLKDKHNLPISIMDHLPGLIANVTSDSKVASAAKCARTKTSAIFKNVMGNPEKLKNKDLTQISVSDPSSFISLGDIYRGAKTESIYLEHSAAIAKRDLEQFQIKTLNFYVTLSRQMLKRFLSNNLFSNLQLLEALDPVNVFQGKPKSLIPLAVKFPNIVDERVYEELNSEWRELTIGEIPALKDKRVSEPEKFWHAVSQERIGDSPRFPNLSNFMLNLMSLPHSSAAAERIFSLVTNIKTKNRSRLKTDTLNGLLHSKNLLQDVDCRTWQPTPKLIDKMNTKWVKSPAEVSQEVEDTQF
ncbi:hypothetical protein Pmani_014407 [Petrolisthes manimaculis]|uniref:HAT C-terminal dimerisation domain-containing protein n=1 Tax=Petrolisthes manimaculis TaxID=1843537 RepID=A0AAE1U8D1_9EUCA|nr:hypothetical protein Pmani_014407 [Petrolisthes manimaculis]